MSRDQLCVPYTWLSRPFVQYFVDLKCCNDICLSLSIYIYINIFADTYLVYRSIGLPEPTGRILSKPQQQIPNRCFDASRWWECSNISFFSNVPDIDTVDVDGKNPAPAIIYETLWNMGYSPYQMVQDFFHQQYFLLSGKLRQVVPHCFLFQQALQTWKW